MKKYIPHYYLYGEDSPVNELEFLHIETIAERTREYHWEIEAHRHDNLGQLLLIEEGHIRATLDTEHHDCYGPAIVWVPPTHVHGFRSQPDTQVIHKRLIMEAKRSLVYTSMLVSAIAFDLGFKDPAYFSRYFTNQTGDSAI